MSNISFENALELAQWLSDHFYIKDGNEQNVADGIRIFCEQNGLVANKPAELDEKGRYK